MVVLRLVNLKLAAGASDSFAFQGNYIRVKTFAFPEGIDIDTEDEQGAGLDFNLVEGEDVLLEDSEFKRLRITNKAGSETNIVLLVGKNVKVNSAKVSGSVSVTTIVPSRSTVTQSQVTVTSTAAQLIAANSVRSYLMIQNRDAVGNIYLNFSTTATIANGFKLGPGESFVAESNMFTSAVSAIGDLASNPNVVVCS